MATRRTTEPTSTQKRGPPQRTLRHRALSLLTRREYSRRELAQRLAPHAQSEAELDTLLKDLEQRKYLSDDRYADARAGVLGRKFGTARIEYELQSKGVPAATIARVAIGTRASELERARDTWQRRFGKAPADALERARQMRFLQGRGFSFETIRLVIGRAGVADCESGETGEE